MNSAIITTESSQDLKLLLELAKKINITTKLLSKEEEEELGLINAIKSGRTKEYIDTDKFLNKITQ
ncbi:MAG: hypothetical protein L3J41_04765 [Melioribacteraceae bacterium]|nr:hypothetical protein [Melioribacteraceae bacterium]